jgi:hypothetical protein
VFHLFLALLLYGVLSLLSVTIAWAMIAQKGFEGLATSTSFMARLFNRFAKAGSRSLPIGYDFSLGTSNSEQMIGFELQYVTSRSVVQNDGTTLGNSQPNEALGTFANGLP